MVSACAHAAEATANRTKPATPTARYPAIWAMRQAESSAAHSANV